MVHERRIAPVDGKRHIKESAYDPGLGNHPVLGRALAILEVVSDEVGVIDGKVGIPVEGGNDVVAGVETELVHLCLPVIVSILLAGGIDVVAGKVLGEQVCCEDVLADGLDGTHVGRESVIHGGQRRLGILVGLIERLHGDDALLGDIKQVLVAGSGEKTCKTNHYDE